MDSPTQLTRQYIHTRFQNPTWVLLASRRAPLVLSCLQTLLGQNPTGTPFEQAMQSLATLLEDHANEPDFDINSEDYVGQARKELREWIKRNLIVERSEVVYATHALEEAFKFVKALEGRLMTSTASRLAIVQREIESLEANLNDDPQVRTQHLKQKIAELEKELAAVQSGSVEVLNDAEATERMQEVYNLASGLRGDFRRVEDSWRQADHELRQAIISEQHHRGSVVDNLLDSHATLLNTPEGRVFQSFYQQLQQPLELELMKERLRTLLSYPAMQQALNPQQQNELRWLTMSLVDESATVIDARTRSEQDVKGFLKAGVAIEHHRVGTLLQDIFQQALKIDWQQKAVRTQPSPLPPRAIAYSSIPVVERLRFKCLVQEGQQNLELSQQYADLQQIDDEFWQCLDGLDRAALIGETLQLLEAHGGTMTLAELAQAMQERLTTHDLEILALWLSMAREAEMTFTEQRETIAVTAATGVHLRFYVPKVYLCADALAGIEWEL